MIRLILLAIKKKYGDNFILQIHSNGGGSIININDPFKPLYGFSSLEELIRDFGDLSDKKQKYSLPMED